MDTPEPQKVTLAKDPSTETRPVEEKKKICAEKKKGVCDAWYKLAPEVRMEMMMRLRCAIREEDGSLLSSVEEKR
jgi:hypothetical protein